jgi:hypothetical protein
MTDQEWQQRIDEIRRVEGFDGRKVRWHTLGDAPAPLVPSVAPRRLAVMAEMGWRPGPEHDRFRRRQRKAAS